MNISAIVFRCLVLAFIYFVSVLSLPRLVVKTVNVIHMRRRPGRNLMFVTALDAVIVKDKIQLFLLQRRILTGCNSSSNQL